MEKEYAEYLLKQTQENYNLIAEDYARTRAFIPEDLQELGRYTKEGDKVLDLGCANGRFYEVLENKNVDFYGIDFANELIKMAKDKYPKGNFFVTDALNLPLSENFFDKIYSISVLHNIPSENFRLQYLKEAKRVLKPRGLFIIRVWDFWKRKEGLRLFFKYTLLKLLGQSKLDFKDVFLPWKNSKGEVIIQRYFHCFTKRELENSIKNVSFEIRESWRAGKDPRTNIYIVAQKSP